MIETLKIILDILGNLLASQLCYAI